MTPLTVSGHFWWAACAAPTISTIPCPRVELGEPPTLLLTRRLVPVACHQQHRAPDAGQRFIGQFGTADAVLVQCRDQVAPVLGPMGGLVQASQRERPSAVQMTPGAEPGSRWGGRFPGR